MRKCAVSALALSFRLYTLYIIAVISLTGCTFSVISPKYSFDLVNNVEQKGYSVDYAFNSYVLHMLGVTLSVSGSYMPKHYSVVNGEGVASTYTYRYQGRHDFALVVKEGANCVATSTGKRELTAALTKIFRRVGGLPSDGRVILMLTNGPIKRYAFNIGFGRKFSLDYRSPCFPNRGDVSLWYAAMLALHESTHSTLALVNMRPEDVEGREKLAIGSESCLLIELSKGEDNFALQYPELLNRISGSLQLQNKIIKTSTLCDRWKNYLLDVNAAKR